MLTSLFGLPACNLLYLHVKVVGVLSDEVELGCFAGSCMRVDGEDLEGADFAR